MEIYFQKVKMKNDENADFPQKIAFCEKLKILRTEKKLTQEQLAEKLFVSRVTVSKWESGRGLPNIDSLKLLADILCVLLLFLPFLGSKSTYYLLFTFSHTLR